MQTANAARIPAAIRDLVAARREGWCLEQPFYTDEAILRVDMERIFRRYWLFVGHTSQIPEPGDYFTYAIGGDSLIILRDDDGQIQALFNVCRHRGSQLCTEPFGHIRKLICPYHQWVYERDGALASARMMPEDFDKSSFGLHRASVRSVEGLIFISLAADPPDFTQAARDYTAHLLPYELEQTQVCAVRRYEVEANWKLITENFRECYHCPGGHPEYCRVVFGQGLDLPVSRGENYRHRMQRYKNLGLETLSVDFSPDTWHHCSRYPFAYGFVCESLDGQPVAPLLGRLQDHDAGIFAIVMYPNFWLEASSDHVWTMQMTPLTPTRSEIILRWLVRADAVEGRDYDVERVMGFWTATSEQDWALCERNQAGVNSSHYQPGPYAPEESEVEIFVRWYLKQLTDSA
jgi:Rieske 2Fe-2S family protein